MKRKILLGLTLAVVVGTGVFWWSSEKTIQAGELPKAEHPLERINRKAKDARSGDLAATKELVKEVIAVSGFTNELQGFTSTSIIERVGKAESNYRTGQSEGIPESKIVRTINGLAIQLNLPEFAKTNSYEVRKLRVSLIPNFPDLIGQRAQNTEVVKAGSTLDATMSPAEAVLLLSMMINQKLSNPNYQLTSAEITGRWNEIHNHSKDSLRSVTPLNDRSRELQTALGRGANALSIRDALQFSDLVLNTLGVEETGGNGK